MPRRLNSEVAAEPFWEGNVATAIAAFLKSEGWTDIQVADTANQERGVDVEARLGRRELALEVKGYPSRRYVAGTKAGQLKPTQPSLQARHWFSHALLSALRMRSAYRTREIAIGLPDHRPYPELVDSVRESLWLLGVGLILTDQHGKARWDMHPELADPGQSELPDARVSAQFVSFSADSSTTTRGPILTWRDGSILSSGDISMVLADRFVVNEPGDPPRRLRPTDGERFIVALPWAVRGTYSWIELIDVNGRTLDSDEVLAEGRRLGFEV